MKNKLIESLLRRFVTPDTKLILTAMERWAETEFIDDPRVHALVYPDLAHKRDNRVHRAVYYRLVAEGNRRAGMRLTAEKAATAATCAAQVLLGEKFEKAVQNSTQHHVGLHKAALHALQNAARQQGRCP